MNPQLQWNCRCEPYAQLTEGLAHMAHSAAIVLACFCLLWHIARAIDDDSKYFLCDSKNWKKSKHVPELFEALAKSWCDASVQNAVSAAREANEQLQECSSSLQGMKQCEREKESGLVEWKQEILLLQAKFAAERDELRAQVAYWKEKCQNKMTEAECKIEIQAAVSKCPGPGSGHLDSTAVELRNGEDKLESLEETLASCRLGEALADVTRSKGTEAEEELRKQVKLLYRLLTILGTTFFGVVPLAALAYIWMKGDAQDDSSAADKDDQLTVLTASQTRDELSSMYEKMRSSSRSRPLLTSLDSRGVFLLLIPFNRLRRRSFALFSSGGDFSKALQAAKTIAMSRRSQLLIVLYDYNGGRALSSVMLHELGMSPESVAKRAAPSDGEYPTHLDILVLCNLGRPALINGDGESLFGDIVEELEWVQYLCR